MVQFGVSSVEQAMNLGREAAEYISGTFTKVTVYFCFLFYSLMIACETDGFLNFKTVVFFLIDN